MIMLDDTNCGDDGNETRLSLFDNATAQCPPEEELKAVKRCKGWTIYQNSILGLG